MLAGCRPFKAKTPLVMVQKQIREARPSLLDLVPGLPPAAVRRMLAKSPDARFLDVQQTATALVEALVPGARAR